jgi:predicted metal-dependent hydrolase
MTFSSPLLRAVATCVVPEAARLDPAQWDELEAIVARAVAARSRAVQRQLALFLTLLEWLPLLRYARRLSRLDPARREKFLDRLQRAPLLLLRRGFWGVRTLILMGYYGRPAAAADIGYRADARGWEARR